MLKKGKLGKPQAKVGYLNIRTISTYQGLGKDKQIIKSTIGIYHCKKLIEDGFKNKESAIVGAKKILEL